MSKFLGGAATDIYAIPTAYPRSKFQFDVELFMNGLATPFSNLKNKSYKLQKIADVSMPGHQFSTMEVNQYNIKRTINIGTAYTPVTLTAYDTRDGIKSDSIESILKGYDNIKTKVGNGYDGWEDNAPYDRIMVTAMSDSIPLKLVDQLKYEGKMIIPIKHKFLWGWGFNGRLCLVIRTGTNHMLAPTYDKKSLIRVQFVPLVRD